MKPSLIREELVNLKEMAECAIEDLDRQEAGLVILHGYRVHLNDLVIESATLQRMIDDDEKEDHGDDHHNDEGNGN